MLIGLGATHSFVSCEFVTQVGTTSVPLDFCIEIRTPTGESLWPTQVLRRCFFWVNGQEMEMDLILLDLQRLDVILGIDWLAANYALVNCFKKEVTFRRPGFPVAMFYGQWRSAPLGLISTSYAHHLLRKGYMGLLAYVYDISANEMSLGDFSVVRDFLNIFPDEIPR